MTMNIAAMVEPDRVHKTVYTDQQIFDAEMEKIWERNETFLILPHPEVAKYMANRGATHDRWLAGMRKLQAHLGGLERPPQ